MISLPEISLSRGEVGAVVPALVVPVAGQATAPSSSHLPITEQPGGAQHCQAECDQELEMVHVCDILTSPHHILPKAVRAGER